MDDYRTTIWMSSVNTLLGGLFIASFAAGAGLLIWHAAFGTNPIAQAIAQEVYEAN